MYLVCRVNIHLYHPAIRLPFLSTFASFSHPYKHNLARIVHVMDFSLSTIGVVVIIFVDITGVRVCNSPEKLFSIEYCKINNFVRSSYSLSPFHLLFPTSLFAHIQSHLFAPPFYLPYFLRRQQLSVYG